MFCFVLWLLQLFRHINVSPETLPLCFIQLCCALCAFAVFFSICWCVFLELAVCLTSQSHHKKVYFYSFLFVQDRHSKTFTSVASPSHTNPLHVFHSHILFHRLLFLQDSIWVWEQRTTIATFVSKIFFPFSLYVEIQNSLRSAL